MWPTVQQRYQGSTSTPPPRVARLCQIREASLVALRKFPKNLRLLTCVDRSTHPIHPTRIQRFPLSFVASTICQVNSSRSAQYPCQALISICGISRVPVLSFRCHLDSHRSWLMTSLEVSEIPNLESIGISCECVSSYDLLLVSLPPRVLWCCLLSRVSGMIVQSLSVWLVRKSTQLPVHQEHTFSDSPLDKATVLLSSTFTRQETECKMCYSSSLDHRPSQRHNIPWCVSGSCSSHSVSMQVSSSGDSVLVFLTNISTPSWNVSNLQVSVTQVCMTSIFVANIRSGLTPIMYCSFPTTSECWIWSNAVVSSCRFKLFCSVKGVITAFAFCSWTMSKHSSTYLAVGFTVNPLRSPSCTLRYSNLR